MANNPIERFFEFKARFFDALLYQDVGELPFLKRLALKTARICAAILRDFSDGQINMRAMSLVYTTLLSLAPVLAICFSVLKGFGVHNQIRPFLLNLLEPLGSEGEKLVGHIIGFVDNIEVGVLGVVGIAVLLWTVISLMTKIERAFNYTWNVSEARRVAARFSDYLSVLLVGPLLIVISLGLKKTVANSDFVRDLFQLDITGPIVAFLLWIAPYLLLTAAFTFIYVFMPNTRVRAIPALIGGAVTAVLWKILGFVFAALVVGSASYSAIYSAFAILVIFMVWLYVGWLVLLIGACIAYYVQNPSNVMVSRESLHMSNEMRERLALSIVSRVGLGFYTEARPYTIEDMAYALKLPIRVIQRSVGTLKSQGLLVQDGEKPFALLPGKPFDTLTIAEFLKAVRSVESKSGFISSRIPCEIKVLETMRRVDRGIEKEFADLTVKRWVLEIIAPAKTKAKAKAKIKKKKKKPAK